MKTPPGCLPEAQDSDEPYRRLVDSFLDYAIVMLDCQGRFLSWNQGAERITGYRADEIIHVHVSRLYPQEAIERGWPDQELAMAGRQGQLESEGWRVRKDGSRFWAHLATSAVEEDGNLICYSQIIQDVTERREREQSLRQSEERFRLLVEAVKDYAIFMLDPQGIVLSWNDGAERIKGWSAAEIIGQHFSRFYPKDALERGWPQHELAVARREGRFEDEGWRLRKDGTRFWANVVITAVFDEQGELRGFSKVTRDLTERRKVEELEQEGRRISEVLAMLGHELRNPMAPMRNAISLLRLDEAPPEVGERAREIIERQLGHLGHIVDDLLDVGRISLGKISVEHAPVDLRATVREIVESVRPLFERKGQRLEAMLPDAPLRVLGDHTRVSQVVLNLLSNANRYTQAEGHVVVELGREEGVAELRVRDDGIGIAPEQSLRIFDMCVQGDRTLDHPEGGLGIGLTLVKKLVELHGGTVSASSEGPGHGSEFVVRLPLLAGEQRSTDPQDAALAARLAGHRVLVVDDNDDASESLALLLEHWGHDVRIAGDGHAALAAAAEHDPDVVLLDIGLPGLDGYAVAERLRGSGPLLIAMTGYGQFEDAERAKDAGFAEHLVKPVDPHHLRQLLADLSPRRR